MGNGNIVHHAYVISDLHLGGRFSAGAGDAGFRMMDRPDALARFIRALAGKPAVPGVELVINGDFLDFLAEDDAGTWKAFRAEPGEAVTAFDVLASRKEDGEVFDALAELLDAGHRLTILVGNHDIELTWPEVRDAFERRLWKSKKSRAFNLRTLLDGEALILGDAVIEHGNRYDPANFVDHERLRRARELRSRRLYDRERDVFHPPVGSRLVAEVMNPIKKEYPFIDLLKPESEALFALLLALDPSKRDRLGELAVLLAKMPLSPFAPAADPGFRQPIAGRDGGKVVRRPIAGTRPGAGASRGTPRHTSALLEAEEDGELTAMIARILPGGDRPEAERAVQLVTGDSGGAVTRGHVAALDRIKAWVGLAGLLGSSTDGEPSDRLPLLRHAVRALTADQSFEDSIEAGKRYLRAARQLASGEEGTAANAAHGAPAGFRFVVFGHTHHRKKVELVKEAATYLNTGTWANLMRFPAGLNSEDDGVAMAALKDFVASVQTRTFKTEFVPTYAHIALREGGHVDHADLAEFDPQTGKVE